MTSAALVSLLFFISAALMVAFAYRYYSRDYTAKRKVNWRLSLIERFGDQREVLAILRREHGVAPGDTWHWLDGLRTIFVQSGLNFGGHISAWPSRACRPL